MDHQFEYDQEADAITVSPSDEPLPTPLIETVARLRALAVLLCLDVELAEELVGVTLTRASVGFDPSRFDPNLSAWLYRRLRSYYYRDYAPHHEASRAPAFRTIDQSAAFAALAELPVEQREALILVETAGFSLNEAAAISRCTRSRFKELLRRARAGLARALPLHKSGTSKPATVVTLFASAQVMA
jgi:RNA polymerase sigma-70 factor (ECF subfamily)